MVNPQFLGGLAARAVLYAASNLETRAENKETYASNTGAAVITLRKWYNSTSGLWDTTGWWNSGNVLTVLADFAMIDSGRGNSLNIKDVVSNTFTQAQKATLAAQKSISESTGMVASSYTAVRASAILGDSALALAAASGNPGFLNHFYDDEGWWALAWIRAYDVYKDERYLAMAESIFGDMRGGTDGTCGGGIWWNKSRQYKNAITNELYLSVAAALANRVAQQSTGRSYYNIAEAQWSWFKQSGMINGDGLINDGLEIRQSDGACVNNGQQTWTYNQGVVLGGLVELHAARAKYDGSRNGRDLLESAFSIATAAITRLTNSDGILVERGCEPKGCGDDGAQFKGIFVRNLRTLFLASPDRSAYRDFILRNADSIWSKSRDPGSGGLGLVWSGPFDAEGVMPTAGTHSSAMDALVAAVAVAPN